MNLLHWASTYLRPLGRFPLLPQLFDLLLTLHSLLLRRPVFQALEALTQEVGGWDGVTLSHHRFGGRQFDRGARELGHVHGNGVVDVLLDRAQGRDAVAEGRAVEHHTFPASGWVSLQLRGPLDVPAAAALLRLSYDKERPAGVQKRKEAEPQKRPALTASGK